MDAADIITATRQQLSNALHEAAMNAAAAAAWKRRADELQERLTALAPKAA